MGSFGLQRAFAVAVGTVLIVFGLAGSIGNPIVGRPDATGLIVTGFGHDLVHLVTGALYVHVGVALNGRNRAMGLVGLGVFCVASGLLSLIDAGLLGLYGASASGLDQLVHLALGIASITIGWMGRGVERREFGRAASRSLSD